MLILPWGLLPILLALALPAPLTAFAALIAGFGTMVFTALWETTLQQHIPPRSLSRVSAYDWFGSLAGQPIAYACVGTIAGAAGVVPTLYGAAGLTILTTLAMLVVPDVRRVGPTDAIRIAGEGTVRPTVETGTGAS